MSKPSKALRKYLASLGRKGAKVRLKKLTPEERREVARKAARARWGRRRKKSSTS